MQEKGKLLHIIATPREGASRTLQVSKAFLDAFKEKFPHWQIDELNLFKEKMPALSVKTIEGKYLLLGDKEFSKDIEETWAEVVLQIQRFLSADIYLISSPMWNFSIPYALKHYIDVIVQPKYLFRYNSSGNVEGLAKNKKMIVITSSGGDYRSTGKLHAYDFLEPYLRTISQFVGITDITFIKAEPMSGGENAQKQTLEEAKASAQKIVQEISPQISA